MLPIMGTYGANIGSSCRRWSGRLVLGWYSIVRPCSGVLSSASTKRRTRVLGALAGVSALVVNVTSSPVLTAAVTPTGAFGLVRVVTLDPPPRPAALAAVPPS